MVYPRSETSLQLHLTNNKNSTDNQCYFYFTKPKHSKIAKHTSQYGFGLFDFLRIQESVRQISPNRNIIKFQTNIS